MNNSTPHIIWVLANSSSAPYFNWFAEQAKSTSNIKLSFVCLYSEKPQMLADMQKYGYDCYWIKYDYHQRKRGLIKSAFMLYKLFKKIKPDIVHSHLFDDSIISLIAAKIALVKRRVITKGDAGFHFYYTPQWVIFDKFNNFLATDIIAISEESKKMIIEKEKADLKKISLIHHGIPTELYAHPDLKYVNEFKKKWQLENKFVIGTVSRFIEWKGYKDIVKVAELLVPKIPEICFLLVGSGPQKEEIIRIIKNKQLEKYFCMPGYIQPVNMPSVYAVMNAYLHAAHFEPFGFVIAEALAAGLPLVSTPTGAAKDAVIHGENGWLANYDNPEKLAEYIMEVYQKKIIIPWQPAVDAASQYYEFKKMFDGYIRLYSQLK